MSDFKRVNFIFTIIFFFYINFNRIIFLKIVNKNYILHGHYGTGKTSLARILIGKYSKDKAFLEINSSLYTSIDVLRSEIENFCKFTPMMSSESDIKYIFLDQQ